MTPTSPPLLPCPRPPFSEPNQLFGTRVIGREDRGWGGFLTPRSPKQGTLTPDLNGGHTSPPLLRGGSQGPGGCTGDHKGPKLETAPASPPFVLVTPPPPPVSHSAQPPPPPALSLRCTAAGAIGTLGSASDCRAAGVDAEGLSGLGGGQGAWRCSDVVTRFGCVTGQQLHVYKAHTRGVYGVAIAPNGQFFITASADDTAIKWSCETGL